MVSVSIISILISPQHCVKSVRIQTYSGPVFLYSDWIPRFSPHAGKCGPE